jgi:putative flavoprotein involved in K+ transport
MNAMAIEREAGQPPVVVVGAGPYGLSIAAHLAEAGIPHRIFGGVMQMWRERMPVSMTMKSDGFASNLSAGRRRSYTFRQFCEEHNVPYTDQHFPMPREVFVAYGMEFQRRFVSQLDARHVALVEREGNGFTVTLEDGERLPARSVICATGIMHYPFIPETLAKLPEGTVSHSSAHTGFEEFRDRYVAVIGGGASAMQTSAMLYEAGAEVAVVTRKPRIVFHDPPDEGGRSLAQRIRHPQSKLGPGLRSWLAEKAPWLFHKLPIKLRRKIVQKHLGPASSWQLYERVMGKVRLILGRSLTLASMRDDSVELTLVQGERREELIVDHVIAATGYRVDLNELKFIRPLLAELNTGRGGPVLDKYFQSSVPGLYFVGIPAAVSFGPLLRFVAGAEFAAKVVTRSVR